MILQTFLNIIGSVLRFVSGFVARRPVSIRRFVIVGISIVTAFFVSTLSLSYLAAPNWSAEIAFYSGTTTQHDMILDSQNSPNIACLGTADTHYGLVFVKRVQESWNFTLLKSVDEDYRGVSIALDSQDRAYVCTGRDGDFYKESNLTFATNRNGQWDVEDIPLGPEYRYLSSAIAVDSDENAHILCTGRELVRYNTSSGYSAVFKKGHLMHFYETSGGWERSDIFPPVGNSTPWIIGFEIGGDDSMHALVRNNFDGAGPSTLNYSSTMSGNWTQENVANIDVESSDDRLTGGMSMAIDDDGRAHICGYLWHNSTASYSIAYLNNENGDWLLSDLAYAGDYDWGNMCSIALDSKGAVHIAYYATSSSNQTERYLTNRDGLWQQEIIDDKQGWDTQRICLIVGHDDSPHISYFCREDRYAIMFARPTGTTEALGDAAIDASWYTLLVALLVSIGILVYRRSRKELTVEERLLREQRKD